MQRITKENKTHIIGYHTQEYRCNSAVLGQPIKCRAENAWLGQGYYFWVEIEFAHHWGRDYKIHNTGSYDVYEAHLDTEKCINATFDEKGYDLFKTKIEKAIEYLETTGEQITLKEVNRFLADKVWKLLGVTGIIYDDLPRNIDREDKNRVFSQIEYFENKKKQFFYYRKRIQIVLFDLKNVADFNIHLEDQN